MNDIINYRLVMYSHLPPKYTNVLWLYPIDEKHFDLRVYATVQEDEYTKIKKWTSIGISDLDYTDITTDSWYVGTVEDFPSMDLSFIEKEVSDISFEELIVENIVFTPIFLLGNLISKLREKQIYFDTMYIDPLESNSSYYAIVIPADYRVNSITKENYYEGTKEFKEDFLVGGNYKYYTALETNGKLYKVVLIEFDKQDTPYQITTNVLRDFNISNYISQKLGNSVNKTISQKTITEYINELKDKVDSIPTEASITNELGYNTNLVISQKTVTQLLEKIAKDIINKADSSLVYSKDEINTKLQIKLDKLPTYENNKVLSVNSKGELEWVTPSSEIPDIPEIPTKLSQLENDTNFTEGMSIITINEWVNGDNLSNEGDYIMVASLENQRVIITKPLDTPTVFITPSFELSEFKTFTSEFIFSTGDSVPEIGFYFNYKWSKEPIFNPNKTYAISIEGNRTADGNTEYLAMYAEFDTLNMEE